jgi:hypothetical protein
VAYQLTQEGDDPVFYIIDAPCGPSKGHTCYPGHTIKSPFEFALITDDRDEWELWDFVGLEEDSEGSIDDEPSEESSSEGPSSQEI